MPRNPFPFQLLAGLPACLPAPFRHAVAAAAAGRLPDQNNAVVNLDMAGAQPAAGGGAFAEQTAWPEFHNGVAAGLRLAPGAHQQTTRTWVVYNKPAGGRWVGAGCGAGG